ncbi:MAG: hypothetical protein IIZ89_01060 [Muribaculaceae bacterium]|nr:hypothetical protein [Muribaculaceae bacterium]
MNKWLAAIVLLLAAMSTTAQQVEWSVDFAAVVNNREGGNAQTPDQTFVFTRLAPEIGLSLPDSTHLFKGGVAWYQPMIDNGHGYKVLPTLYYQYRGARWRAAVGMLPRTLLREPLPQYLWSDSLNYCTPNIRGVLVQYVAPRGYAEIMLDWRQLQTRHQREAFVVGINTEWNVAGPLLLGGHVQYNHLAKRRDAGDEEGVNDDATINPLVGLRLGGGTVSATVRAGAVVQLQRRRADYKWHTPCSFVAHANLQWRWLDVTEQIHAGKDLFPLYELYGSQFNLGDPYYRSKFYSRTDLRAHVVRNRFVDLSVLIALHATDKTFGCWQQIACRVYIDNHLWKHRRDRDYLNGARLSPLF